jgi:serine/threonine protein kinase, bacterial
VEGTTFGRYQLLQVLGRGGMGVVWRAHDTATDRVVAVKLLSAHLVDDESFVKRFRREAHAAAQLNSPHVIPIHNYGEIDGRLYVDMRLVEGRDLASVLADGPLETERAVRIIEQVAKALHAAHKVGLVHRDVKPSNILLDEDDFAYLIDFGIARATEDTRLTDTGGMVGTLHYMAPERLSTGEVDARADIYALACVLYECLTGSCPFPGEGLERQIVAHLSDPPPQPSSTHPEVPHDFDDVIARGRAKEPRERYGSTVELAAAAHDAVTTPMAKSAPSTGTRPLAATTTSGRAVDLGATERHQPDEIPAQRERQPGIDQSHQPAKPRRWWHRKSVIIPAAAGLLAVVVAVAAVAVIRSQNGSSSAGPPPQTASSRQVVLPFTGLKEPNSVAVDSAGAIYVADSGNNRMVKLAAGASSETVLPFTDLSWPVGVAVDSAGAVYVGDTGNGRVVALAPGAASQTVLPFTGLSDPLGVAVNGSGTVYVADYDNSQVVALTAGATTPTVLPFDPLKEATGIAADKTGAVYVVDSGNNRVVKLDAGASSPTVLPFGVLDSPNGVAVDSTGAVYVADGARDRVMKLAAGASSPTVLPFTDLDSPNGVAVDNTGTVYLADTANHRVVALAP